MFTIAVHRSSASSPRPHVPLPPLVNSCEGLLNAVAYPWTYPAGR